MIPGLRMTSGCRLPLSRRELEIVKLVAAGLTNRQIAGRLFIAEPTVDGHLEHVREKLAVNTRAQIAAWRSSASWRRAQQVISVIP
jgi:DNA-binding CsgD family transcriptional regulator